MGKIQIAAKSRFKNIRRKLKFPHKPADNTYMISDVKMIRNNLRKGFPFVHFSGDEIGKQRIDISDKMAGSGIKGIKPGTYTVCDLERKILLIKTFQSAGLYPYKGPNKEPNFIKKRLAFSGNVNKTLDKGKAEALYGQYKKIAEEAGLINIKDVIDADNKKDEERREHSEGATNSYPVEERYKYAERMFSLFNDNITLISGLKDHWVKITYGLQPLEVLTEDEMTEYLMKKRGSFGSALAFSFLSGINSVETLTLWLAYFNFSVINHCQVLTDAIYFNAGISLLCDIFSIKYFSKYIHNSKLLKHLKNQE